MSTSAGERTRLRLFLLPLSFLLISVNSREEIVAAAFARTRPSLWWQSLCERCYTLPVMCTCATLISCTGGKSICPPWQSKRTDGAWGGSRWPVSLSRLCYSWNTLEALQICKKKIKKILSSRWAGCISTVDPVRMPLMNPSDILSPYFYLKKKNYYIGQAAFIKCDAGPNC